MSYNYLSIYATIRKIITHYNKLTARYLYKTLSSRYLQMSSNYYSYNYAPFYCYFHLCLVDNFSLILFADTFFSLSR